MNHFPARNSKFAVASLIVGIAALVLVIFVIGGLIAPVGIVLAIIGLVQINKRPRDLGGKGFAIAGIVLNSIAFLGLLVMVPLILRSMELSNRSYCAANLRGIQQSMNVYAADQMDTFPTVLPPKSAGTYTFASAGNSGATNADRALEVEYTKGQGAGSVTACWWILVLKNQVSPKQFFCHSDRTAGYVARLADASNCLDLDFQASNQFSYSSAYPWLTASWAQPGSVGGWWKNITDSSLPIMSDIAPKIEPGGSVLTNSATHGAGQNVVFSDGHVEFCRRADIGPNNDNIWTHNGTSGPSERGTVISGGSVGAGYGAASAPFDIIMVPIRDGSGVTH